MSRNDDNTTRNLLDFSYHQIYYKPIGIYLSRETNKIFSNKLISQKNLKKIMVQKSFYS